MFESANVLRLQQLQRQHDESLGIISEVKPPASPTSSSSSSEAVTYPPRPVPPALAADILSTLPPGLVKLSFSHRLTLQFLSFIRIFVAWKHSYPDAHLGPPSRDSTSVTSCAPEGPISSLTELSHSLLGIPELPFLDRLLVVAVQAYLNWWELHVRRWTNFSSELEVDFNVGTLAQAWKQQRAGVADLRRRDGESHSEGDNEAEQEKDEMERDAIIWSWLMIRDSTSPGSGPWNWASARIEETWCWIGAHEHDHMRRLDGLFFARPTVVPSTMATTQQ